MYASIVSLLCLFACWFVVQFVLMVAWKIIRLFSSYPLFLSPTSLPPLQSFLPPFLSPFRSSLSHFFTHHDGAQVLANEKASFFVCGVLQQIAEHDASSKAITRSSLRHQFRSFLAQHLVLCHAILPSISNNSSQLLCLTCMPVQLLAAASQHCSCRSVIRGVPALSKANPSRQHPDRSAPDRTTV